MTARLIRRQTVAPSWSPELVGARSAFGFGLVGVALEHEHRRSPDVDFRYHAPKLPQPSSTRDYPNQTKPHRVAGPACNTGASGTVSPHIEVEDHPRLTQPGEYTEWPAAAHPGKSPISSRIIESTFVVGRRFRCTMRVDCGELDPRAVIRQAPGEWHPHMPQRLDEEELADWRAGRNAVYQLAALTIGARLAVADA